MGLFDNGSKKPSGGTTRPSSVFAGAAARSPFDLEKLANRFRYRDTGWTIPEAYLALLLLAAGADNEIKEEEILDIMTAARRSPALRAYGEEELGALERSAQERIAQNKEAALQEACLTLPADMCLSVFAHCVDLVLADGELVEAEARWLEELYPKLDIDEDYARRIAEVLLLKAKY